jgi:hypothetical protein
VAILQPVAAASSSAGPQSREQGARIVTYLTPMALAAAPNAEAGEALAVQTAFGAKLLPNPYWPVDEGSAPVSHTFPLVRRDQAMQIFNPWKITTRHPPVLRGHKYTT